MRRGDELRVDLVKTKLVTQKDKVATANFKKLLVINLDIILNSLLLNKRQKLSYCWTVEWSKTPSVHGSDQYATLC